MGPIVMSFNEKQASFDGIPFAYLQGGHGFPVLMIHGSGPGASTAGNWSKVLGPLSGFCSLYGMDLIGFGRSGRKPHPPFFDFNLWFQQCRSMIELIPGDQVGIIGHSISGALALKVAAYEPRVTKVLTTGCMGAPFNVNEDTIRTWTFPRNREELICAAKGLIYDSDLINEAYLQTRERVLFGDPNYGAYFESMFAGDKQAYVQACLLTPDELRRIRCEILMMHGRSDQAFPAEPLTLTLAKSLPQADVVLLGQCSHSIAMEYPHKLIDAARGLFTTAQREA
jgi:2-hydroxymuconate-semialdehyde hydrolase